MFNKTISKLKSEITEKEKEICDLQNQISELKTKTNKIPMLKCEIENKDAVIQSLKQELNGERICSGYCSECEHGILIENTYFPPPIGYNSCVSYCPTTAKNYICALNAKCKDFVRLR